MALVDYTYYKGELNIDYSKASTQERLGYYSDYCEKKYLTYLMGETEYNNYLSAKTSAKYVAWLASGTFDLGQFKILNDVKTMLAYFIYYEFVKDSETFNSSVGEQQANVENSVYKMPNSKLIRNYNEGVKMFYNCKAYLELHISDFPYLQTVCIESIQFVK